MYSCNKYDKCKWDPSTGKKIQRKKTYFQKKWSFKKDDNEAQKELYDLESQKLKENKKVPQRKCNLKRQA